MQCAIAIVRHNKMLWVSNDASTYLHTDSDSLLADYSKDLYSPPAFQSEAPIFERAFKDVPPNRPVDSLFFIR